MGENQSHDDYSSKSGGGSGRREKDRDREKRRDRGYDSDRDRDRHKNRDDRRDRSPRRDRDRGRSRDKDRERNRDRKRYYREEEERSRSPVLLEDKDVYKSQIPNNTIMVRGLAQHINENDIRADILACNLTPRDIRLIRKKDSGASRGFAFVEFNTVQEAVTWMERKQGVLLLQDQYRAVLQYSIPRDGQSDKSRPFQDWFCSKCGAHNFKRRDNCFKCSVSRHEADLGGEGSDEVSTHPTNTVLLRSLDPLSTEESVLQVLTAVSALPIRSVRIGRDPLTNASRGICFIEMNSVVDAMHLYNYMLSHAPVIDNKKVLVSYAKLAQLNPASSLASSALAAAQWSNQPAYDPSDPNSLEELSEYSATLYARTPEEHATYKEYYKQYYLQQGCVKNTPPPPSQNDEVNMAAVVAQNALQILQSKSTKPKVVAGVQEYIPTQEGYPKGALEDTSCLPPGEDYPKYPPPDVSQYQYDETSGYYYDPQTSLYYDATSQYYYNASTQQFLYWDADKNTYLPVPMAAEDNGVSGDGGRKKDKKEDKVKVAKRIAKDMERWAKTLNQKKENAKIAQQLSQQQASSSPATKGAADAGFAVLERKEKSSAILEKPASQVAVKTDNLAQEVSENGTANSGTGLVAAYGDSESEEEGSADRCDNAEEKLTDWSKMACLLCKRQFPSCEALTRHQQLSELHKQNMEIWRNTHSVQETENRSYRDRAKERRQKYGEPEPPQPNRLKEKYLKVCEDVAASAYEEPTRKGIGSDNIGNKMLQKMGWSEGQGLGRANQGRTSIIEPERRSATAGLGVRGSTYGAVGDTYKDTVKKMTVARYKELFNSNENSNSNDS